MSDDKIREIFLANGFTIKPGCDDLRPYVYAAAQALLAAERERIRAAAASRRWAMRDETPFEDAVREVIDEGDAVSEQTRLDDGICGAFVWPSADWVSGFKAGSAATRRRLKDGFTPKEEEALQWLESGSVALAVAAERERCLAAASDLRRRLRGTSRQLASELEASIRSGVLT